MAKIFADGQDRFEYKYKGDVAYIDIETLLSSQLHFVTIVNEVQRSLLPEIELKIRVEAPSKGSFIFQHLYQWAVENDIFSKDRIEYISNLGGAAAFIYGAVKGLIIVFSHLKGTKATKIEEQKGDKVKIFNESGQFIYADRSVFNIYTTNQALNEAFRKQAEVLEQDENVDGIQLINKETKEVIVDVPREKFADFQHGNAYLSGERIDKPKPTTRLYIKKPDLFPKSQERVIWEFIYDGKPIKATITDAGFISQINEGLRVGQGDSVIVDLKIIAEFDKRFNTHIDKRYEITSVKSIEPKQSPPKQMNIGD